MVDNLYKLNVYKDVEYPKSTNHIGLWEDYLKNIMIDILNY